MSFYIYAWNLPQGDWSHRYGPFPGTPWVTHNFVRDGDGNHIFEHEDEWREAGWYADGDTEDNPREYGWRRSYETDISFAHGQGPCWTDFEFQDIDPAAMTLLPFDNALGNAIAEHRDSPYFQDWQEAGYFDPGSELLPGPTPTHGRIE